MDSRADDGPEVILTPRGHRVAGVDHDVHVLSQASGARVAEVGGTYQALLISLGLQPQQVQCYSTRVELRHASSQGSWSYGSGCGSSSSSGVHSTPVVAAATMAGSR